MQGGRGTLAEAEGPRFAGQANPIERLNADIEVLSHQGPAPPVGLPYQGAPDPTQEAPQSQVPASVLGIECTRTFLAAQ